MEAACRAQQARPASRLASACGPRAAAAASARTRRAAADSASRISRHGLPTGVPDGRLHVACRCASSTSSASTAPGSGPPLLQTDPHTLVELLVQLSELHVRPHAPWLCQVLDTLQPCLGKLAPAELSGVLQVLGRWCYTASPAFMDALWAATRAALPRFAMRHCADVAWGLAQLAHQPQPLFDELLHRALALMLASGGSSPQLDGLADLVWAVAKLQAAPGDAWLEAFQAASLPRLAGLEPSELAQLVWAFARLPWRPSEAWAQAYLAAVQQRLPSFGAKEISLTAWGLATLKLRPSTRFLFAFERRAEVMLSKLAAAELACTLWSLSELKRKQPHQLRVSRLVRRQQVYHAFDFEALTNPRLLKVVRALTLGPPKQRGGGSS